MTDPALIGKRVLVVEDEYLVSLVIQDVLEDAGCIVIGPFSRLQKALDAVEAETVDVALLDANLAGEKVYPVAQLLEKKGVPFLLLTGYGQAALPPESPHWEACAKPFESRELLERLARKVSAG